tara:strand:- start:285 stop:1880 length:1596 start_codon:yes stop_codon:yes gene_type:complete
MHNNLTKFFVNDKIYYLLIFCFTLLVSFYYFPTLDQKGVTAALVNSSEIYNNNHNQLIFFRLDYTNSWSLILQVIRLLIYAGLSLEFINFLILFISLNMSVYGIFLISKRISNDLFFSFCISCFLVISNINFGNLDYPVILINSHTAGMISHACILLIFGLIADRKLNLAILLSILTVGLHLVVGLWILSILLISIYFFKKEILDINNLTKINLILYILTAIIVTFSFIEFRLNAINIPILYDKYLYQTYIDIWDHHRSKIFGINYKYISLTFLMLCSILFYYRKEKKVKTNSFFFKTVTLQVLISFIIYILWKIFPNLFQGIFLKIIPSRFFLNHSVFGMAIITSIFYFYTKPLLKNKTIIIVILTLLVMHPILYIDKYINKFERIYKNIKLVKRNYDHNFWEKIKEIDIADGLILTSIHTCDKTIQKSKKPILICMESFDGMAYNPKLVIVAKNIIEKIYEIDFFNPPEKNRGGISSDNIYKKTFQERSLKDWEKISKEFNIKGLILPVEWNLRLNKSIIGKKFTYYKL